MQIFQHFIRRRSLQLRRRKRLKNEICNFSAAEERKKRGREPLSTLRDSFVDFLSLISKFFTHFIFRRKNGLPRRGILMNSDGMKVKGGRWTRSADKNGNYDVKTSLVWECGSGRESAEDAGPSGRTGSYKELLYVALVEEAFFINYRKCLDTIAAGVDLKWPSRVSSKFRDIICSDQSKIEEIYTRSWIKRLRE